MADTRIHLLKGTLDVLVLKTLSWGPAHGYGISRWIGQSSADDLQIEEGALYPALRRLEERGLVESEWRRLAETGREARVYRLTPAGQRTLRNEVAAWQRYVAAFARVLEARPKEALA
jgi:transcriptional regulator